MGVPKFQPHQSIELTVEPLFKDCAAERFDNNRH